ncbi:MAG: pantoate--beta-alanine ligase, partial [Candidatus Marinimicrobia bacterium]|nr:pantoate--beta-alanine ligase [Candidatus Neomarinimicrobiota bacterium]
MKIIRNINDMQKYMEQLRLDGKRIGFVPTMGALHEGHLSLCHIAKKHSDMLV